ncbi:MAG: hypothetical protein M1837_000001 [Sclerophora amabilis]|nr:MAG: hypothetical protein M1837_000001 [Sclerophora amabilis]
MPPPINSKAEDLDLRIDPNARRNRQAQRRRERRRRKRERRTAVRRGEVTPTNAEIRDFLSRKLRDHGGGEFMGMDIEDVFDIALEMLQWQHVDGHTTPRIIQDQDIQDFIHHLRSQNWRRELKPPPAVSDREEPRVNRVLVGTLNRDCPESETAMKRRKASEKQLQVHLPPDPIPENRTRGKPIYLQFQKNEVIPSFALQDSSARAVSHRWVALNPGMNLQEEMCRIILQVDDSEQAFVSQYNRSLLIHSARWRLWKKHGNAQDIQQVDSGEAPIRPNKPRCRAPFFKSTQMIAFGERLREAIQNRGLRRLPEHLPAIVVCPPVEDDPTSEDSSDTSVDSD